MEFLTNYLKRNIKLAYKSVLFHFKQYLCFYVALFIIQFLFGIIMMSTVSANHTRSYDVENRYDYHVCLVGVNEVQYKELINNREVIRTDEREVDEKKVYDLYCYFEDDCEEGYADFYEDCIEKVQSDKYNNVKVEVSFSPLYELRSENAEKSLVCVGLLALLLIIGIVILSLLYNIRINHFKFTYGIYMSYGADFKKLFETSVWEILMIGTLTLVPASVVSTVADMLFFVLSDHKYYFSPQCMLLAIPFTAVITYFSVFMPIRRAASKPPLELLLAEDNSNLVISPRLSFNMTNRRFPSSYNLFSAVRFRKYNVQIILSSVIFAILFVFSTFAGSVYSYVTAVDEPEYTVNFEQKTIETVETIVIEDDYTGQAIEIIAGYGKDPSKWEKQYNSLFDTSKFRIDGDVADYMDIGFKVTQITTEEQTVVTYVGDTFTPELANELKSIYGVGNIYKSCSARAYILNSHIRVASNKVKQSADMLQLEDMSYTDQLTYYATDNDIVEYLTANFEYTGDPSLILNNTDSDTHYVIVTNSRNNTDSMKLKVGDSFSLANLIEMNATPSEPVTGNELLKFQIENGNYDYTRFEVCAVIENMSSGSTYPLFVSEADYHLLTNKYPIYKKVDVYTDHSLEFAQLDLLTESLRSWSEKYSYTTLTLNNAFEAKNAQLAQCRTQLIVSAAVMLLAISPLFWFFSQIMFYSKRDKEMDLLRGMGATEAQIKALFINDGIFYALFGGAIVALVSGIGVNILYKVVLRLTSGGSFKAIYTLSAPWIYIAIGVVITVLCGFMSSMVPYSINKRKSERRASVEFGDISADD